MADRFYAVVIGAGPAGEHALDVLLDTGKKVALVERESIGGECSGWACMPTKTLLRPTEVQGEADHVAGVSQPSHDWPKIRDYRRSPRTTRGRVQRSIVRSRYRVGSGSREQKLNGSIHRKMPANGLVLRRSAGVISAGCPMGAR